jgi:cyclic pyranopterin phosphate synthase
MNGMVDIGKKKSVTRRALASGRIRLSSSTLSSIRAGTICKGDVMETAKVAAIQAVKGTPLLIPYCHPIPIESVRFGFDMEEGSIRVECEVQAHYKTGVEMEALAGVSVALLTIWDMVKYIEKDEEGQYSTARIEDIRVVSKEKGD